ncbi:hypothetical protein [Arcobacter sp. YIC-310]|uniref:hypothetical protein n=1 Tax=Arcobacter sp. YIC-310 TaxID=3376632 RepID=UPI003C1F2021
MDNELLSQVGTYLGSLTVLTGGIVWVGKKVFESSATALLENYKKDLNVLLEKEKSEILKEKESFDRKFEETKKWANPILSSVNGITGRLKHIVEQNGHFELSVNHEGYKYYYPSTLYYFSQYLCWIQILKEEINYEIFDEEKNESTFFMAIKDVNIAIREYTQDTDFDERGNPIYSLQQREISELLRKDNNSCMSYYEFNKKLSTDDSFKGVLAPITNLVNEIKPETKEFKRIENILEKLFILQEECKLILKGN